MSTIAQQITALQDMTVAQLAEKYQALYGKPPRVKNKAFLQRRLAWKIQEQAFGGLSDKAKVKLDELIADIDLPLGHRLKKATKLRKNSTRPVMVGTTLVRQWKEQEVRVQVLEDGFEWNRVVYTSLSAVAKAVTGSHWNGRLFFGLSSRKQGMGSKSRKNEHNTTLTPKETR